MIYAEDVCHRACCWTPYGCAKGRRCGHHKPAPKVPPPIVVDPKARFTRGKAAKPGGTK